MRPRAPRSFFTMACSRSFCAARTAASSGPAAVAPEANRAVIMSPRAARRAPEPSGDSILMGIILAREGPAAPGGAHPQRVARDRDGLVGHEDERDGCEHEGRS